MRAAVQWPSRGLQRLRHNRRHALKEKLSSVSCYRKVLSVALGYRMGAGGGGSGDVEGYSYCSLICDTVKINGTVRYFTL